MQRTFKRGLLITVPFLFLFACHPAYQMVSTEFANQMVTAETLASDSSIVRFYMPFKEKINDEMRHVIGYSQTSLVKGKPESKLTNFLADLLLEEGTIIGKTLPESFTPDIAFMNYGGIRAGIPEGDITVRTIFEVMPFENELVALLLPAKDVQALLDFMAGHGGDSVGGVRFKIKNGKAVQVEIGGKPMDKNAEYWLITSDFVADGGDNYLMLKNNVKRINMEWKIRDAMISWFKRHSDGGNVIDPHTDGRIAYE